MRDRLLLADRTAWNKLFRRTFWDAHDFRFPEGVVNEDIPVMLPAHFLASAKAFCSLCRLIAISEPPVPSVCHPKLNVISSPSTHQPPPWPRRRLPPHWRPAGKTAKQAPNNKPRSLISNQAVAMIWVALIS